MASSLPPSLTLSSSIHATKESTLLPSFLPSFLRSFLCFPLTTVDSSLFSPHDDPFLRRLFTLIFTPPRARDNLLVMALSPSLDRAACLRCCSRMDDSNRFPGGCGVRSRFCHSVRSAIPDGEGNAAAASKIIFALPSYYRRTDGRTVTGAVEWSVVVRRGPAAAAAPLHHHHHRQEQP